MGIFSKIWKKVTGWLVPDPPKQEKGFNLEKVGTNQPIPVIYGKYAKAPVIKVFKMSSDVSGGAKNEYLHFICIVCEGEIGAFGEVFFDGVAASAIDSKRYYIEKYTGSDTQTHSAELTSHLSLWKESADLSGLAYLYVRLKQNKDVNWWTSESRITVDVEQGKLITDVRDGQTKYSDNLALCTYDFLVNPRFGKGLSANEINQAAMASEADYNELQRTYSRTVYVKEWDPESRTWIQTGQTVENETVTENLFSCNVMLDTENTIKENVEILLKGARAALTESGGKYTYIIEKEAEIAYAFTTDDLSGGIISEGGSQDKRYNQVIIKYRNRLTGEMDEVTYPESDALHKTWLEEDNNKLLLGEFTIETIDNKAEALQMGHVITQRSRQDLRAQWVGFPWTIQWEAGDVISLTSKINGWTAKPFLIESAEPDLDTGLVKFQGVEHQNTIYPWSVTETTEEYTDTSFYLPSDILPPTGLSFSAADDTSDILGVLAWNDPQDVMVVSHIVEVIDTDTSSLVFSQETTSYSVNIPRLVKGSYTAKVYAKNSLNVSGPTEIALTAVAPRVPNGLTVKAGNFELILTPTIDGAPGTLLFDLKVSADTNFNNSTLIGRARSFVDNNLAPDTERYYWARSINATSESAWSEMFTGKTLADTANFLSLITELEQSSFSEEVSDLLQQVKDATIEESLVDIIDNIELDVLSVGEDTAQVSTEVNSLSLNLNDPATGLAKAHSEITSTKQAVVNETNARSTAINSINATLNNSTTGLAKAHSEITSTKQAVVNETNARSTAINSINATLNNSTTGLAKAHSEITATKQAVVNETNARSTAINSINATLNNSTTGLAKAHSEIVNTKQAVVDEANNRASAIQSLTSRVEDEEAVGASAHLILAAHNDDISELQSQVFLGVDVNGRVTGVYINGSQSQTDIELLSDKISFVNPNTGTKDLLYDAAKKKLLFGGILTVGTLIQSPTIEYVGTTHMRISSATGFGSSNQFIEWFGLLKISGGAINYAALTESNAITYLKTDGSAYFGGSIISGSLSTSLTTSDLSASALVAIGPYGSNGGNIALNCSVTMSSNLFTNQSGQLSKPPVPTCTIQLQEYVNGSWTPRQTASYSGTSSAQNSSEGGGRYQVLGQQSLSGSFTYSDNKRTTTDRIYRVVMTARSGLQTGGQWDPSQRISINSQEN